jgi:hypothetical protein
MLQTRRVEGSFGGRANNLGAERTENIDLVHKQMIIKKGDTFSWLIFSGITMMQR